MDPQTIQALHAELAAACPDIVGVSVMDPADKSTWRIDYADTATDATKAAAQAALDAFDPAAPAKPADIPVVEFFNRFTDAEKAAVWPAAIANPALGVGLIHGLASGTIGLADADTVAFVNGLAAVGAITKDRAAEILTR